MKPELAVLPLGVWADVFESPPITRQWLAEFANNIRNRKFAEKLQKLLHECGKHSLRYLDVSSKQSDESTQEEKIEPECRALLAVSPNGFGWTSHMFGWSSTYKECEFPETDMPENIKTFKKLSIRFRGILNYFIFFRYLDDEILNFLNKIKPLFANVYLSIKSMELEDNMHVLFTHLFPMVTSIRGIHCDNNCAEFLERHFPGTLALARELELFLPAPASIPTYLNWLNAPPQDNFFLHGPRFLWTSAQSEIIFAIVDAVRKQFLVATIQSAAFVIYLQFCHSERDLRADEFNIENAVTKEELTVQNSIFNRPNHQIGGIHYVKILRSPIGADARMQEWIEKRAYYEQKYNNDDEANKEILIWVPTIGHITKQADDNPANVRDDDDADGPSISAERK